MKHVITALVENQPGVLARVVGLISGRGFNIESLNVGPTHEPDVSRMTIQVPGDDRILEQVTKQLNKLVDVIKVADLTCERIVARELLLVRVHAPPSKRGEISDLARSCNAEVAAVQEKSLTLELSTEPERVDDFLALLKPYSIVDITRTGAVALPRKEGNGQGKAGA